VPSADPYAAVTALLVLSGLALVMRWVFKPSRPRSRPPVNASDARELGLLSVVATVSRSEAAATTARLGAAGIRCSISKRDDNQVDVLVFTGDQSKARILLAQQS
jgi:hypothetical protein